jgi:hypothetical protein
MPTHNDLPESISFLAHRNAVPLRPDPDFHRDAERVIGAILRLAPDVAPRFDAQEVFARAVRGELGTGWRVYHPRVRPIRTALGRFLIWLGLGTFIGYLVASCATASNLADGSAVLSYFGIWDGLVFVAAAIAGLMSWDSARVARRWSYLALTPEGMVESAAEAFIANDDGEVQTASPVQ